MPPLVISNSKMVRNDAKSDKDESAGKKQEAADAADAAGDKENVDDSAFEVGTIHSVRKGESSWHSGRKFNRL